MDIQNINILLADDDKADCLLFKEALEELPVSAHLTIVHNGEQVIEELTKKGNKLPDVLFLDLNMPRKNGFAALGQIKRNTELQNLPVIIFSTTSDLEAVMRVFRDAAHYYICKPADFSQLKKVIYEALMLITQKNNPLPLKENFMITGDSIIIPDSTER
ncbi:MAG: response regulator [Saprospiraceae bacterium]|nr:response regulator [Saprospiraceae bacterium]